MFSLWHFLIHCYANLKISQGVSSKLCQSDDLHCRFSGETGSTNKHHPNLAIYLKGLFQPIRSMYAWYVHKAFVADWHWMTFRQVTPAHHCKYSTPDASCAMPSSSSSFGWPRRSHRRWAVGDRLLSRPNHHLHQENDRSYGRQMGTMKTPRNKKQRHKETECIFDIWMYE